MPWASWWPAPAVSAPYGPGGPTSSVPSGWWWPPRKSRRPRRAAPVDMPSPSPHRGREEWACPTVAGAKLNARPPVAPAPGQRDERDTHDAVHPDIPGEVADDETLARIQGGPPARQRVAQDAAGCRWKRGPEGGTEPELDGAQQHQRGHGAPWKLDPANHQVLPVQHGACEGSKKSCRYGGGNAACRTGSSSVHKDPLPRRENAETRPSRGRGWPWPARWCPG